MTDKKTLIFDAVISLIEENGFHTKLKVSDIADKAGIGKGTVYEYFSNKEEIIAESLIYFMNDKFQYVLKEDRGLSFELRIKNFISRVFEIFYDNQNFHGLFMSQSIGSMLSIEKKMMIMSEIFKLKKEINKLIRGILDKGKEEKIIPEEIDDFNIMVLKTTLMSSTMEYILENGEATNKEEFVEKLYNIVVKILN